MTCRCIQRMDRKLAESNTRLDPALSIDFKAHKVLTIAEIKTAKIDRKVRWKPKRVVATFCPFCGKRYRKDNQP